MIFLDFLRTRELIADKRACWLLADMALEIKAKLGTTTAKLSTAAVVKRNGGEIMAADPERCTTSVGVPMVSRGFTADLLVVLAIAGP
ncbi:hypothetical protein NC77_02425 [Janthinobacterium lividum]|nr:hypothetical protein NC77_02425 [Janthinobacterium lividum]